ncbi:porin [Paraburkholderia caffeinilytica]|uniref:Porin n=1 Tax=Paraburkholderia caffeinilytica TaxID=1761016 RepID=A0ABQ1NA58_9BURK|nr:porin [Paraburkholderia caffeinilytica]GGC64257.1 porin [Paraburkholderia caffeinilytica]CAB3800241.1 Outer membrane porin protein [Paraburkholderia caffeinilytica]
MRKVMFGLLAMTATASASAQSSVTLYGIVDNGLQYETGMPKGHVFGAQSGGWAQSRFGLKGAEDIGGGTQAIFHLESRLNTQNGSLANGSFFEGQATVGLKNDKWGQLKFGNMGSAEISQYSGDVDPQQTKKYAIGTLVRGRIFSQAGNGVEYLSPTLGGFTLQGQYDLTNSTKWNSGNPGSAPGQLGTSSGLGSAQGRTDGIKLSYQTGGLFWQATYDEVRDPNGQFSNVYLASRSILTGATYEFGPVVAYIGYQHLSAPNASNAGYFGTATPTTLPSGTSLPTAVNHEWIGAIWQTTPALSLTGAVYHANANHGNGNATLYTLGTNYSLSKRTLLYTELGYVRNSSTSNLGLDSGLYGANSNNDPVSSAASSTNPNYGKSQFGVIAGIAHQF